MHIFSLCLSLCIAQAFTPAYLSDLPTRGADNEAKLERVEDISRIEQQAGFSGAHVLSTDHLPRHEPTNAHSIAVSANESEGAHNEVPPSELEQRVARRDVVAYIALAKEGVDIENYHEPLKTKAEDGSWIYQIGPDEKILGYGNVTLTQDAKTEVENYKDTFGVLEDLPIVSLRVLPTEHAPCAMYENSEPIAKRKKLERDNQ